MTITQLRLRRFKKFADWSASLSPGLTVVRGPNEAGKTTVMEAIFEGLFRDPAGSEGAAGLRSWGEERLGEIALELTVREGRYLLRKDLEAGTVLLQREDGGERIEHPREVQRRLQEWIGMAGEAAYRSTAFVAQAEVARVGEDRRLLGAHLSRILSGAGAETAQEALRWLTDRRARLTSSPGERSLTERLEGLRAHRASLRQREERTQRHRAELRDTFRDLQAAERWAAEQAEAVRLARWAADLRRREQALLEEEATVRDRASRVEALATRLAELDAGLEDFSTQREALIADLFHARRQYLQIQSGLDSASQQAEREERALEHLATRHHTTSRLGGLGLMLAGGGALGIIGGGLIVLLLGHGSGWIVLGLGAALTVAGLRYRGRISVTGVDYRAQEQRVLDLRQKVEIARRQMADAEEMVAVRLRAVGSESLEDVERRFSHYMELLREREEVRAALRQARGHDPIASPQRRLAEITEELATTRAALETAPGGTAPAPGESARLDEDAAQAAVAVQELRERRARLEGVLEELRDPGEEGARLDEEIAALEGRRAGDRESLAVVDLAARMLEEARGLSSFPAREFLERRVGEYLATASGRAYDRVTVDERTLRPQVWIAAAGAWKEPSELSQATGDLLYLCLRLALVDVLTADRRPPLFLDEPFAYMDAQRRRGLLGLLAAAARERQVVLFTCWPDCDEIADQVVRLDGAA